MAGRLTSKCTGATLLLSWWFLLACAQTVNSNDHVRGTSESDVYSDPAGFKVESPPEVKRERTKQEQIDFMTDVLQQCMEECEADCLHDTLPLHLQYLGYDCNADCFYECSHVAVDKNVELGGHRAFKFKGKWPFIRVFGVQEPASTLFSIFNFVPHFVFRNSIAEQYPSYPYVNTIKIYSYVGMNTWIWSTVFHARDTMVTERLDYYGANMFLYTSVFAAIIRVFEIKDTKRWWGVLCALTVSLVHHIHYMYYSLDYDYNMKVMVFLGVVHSALWFWFTYKNPRPYQRYMFICQGIMWVAALLEIWDFSPIWGIFDAHSIWHGATPAVGYYWYQYLISDARFETASPITKSL